MPKQFKYRSPHILTRATAGSVGYDIRSNETALIGVGEVVVVSTGLFFEEIPEGYYFTVNSRSGLATKGIFVVNGPGIIDSDYLGEVKVILGHLGQGDANHFVSVGDKIAQLVIHKVVDIQLQSGFGQLDPKTQIRGAGGFGSTGK